MNSTLLKKIAIACTVAAPGLLSAQIPFVDATSLIQSPNFFSGNSIGVCDMNGDKKDDIVRTDNDDMTICYWQSGGNFIDSTYTYALSDPWGMCVGDVNNDGFNDVQWGEGASSRLMVYNGSGGYTGSNVSTLTGAGSIFVQGCNFQDINNDGNLDMFICNDVAMSHIYIGDGNNGWTYNNSVEMPLATVPASDNSGNYASIWSDINNDGYMDLMITHCRQGVTSPFNDPRRVDQVFINNGDYTYTQDVTNWTNLLDGAQGWSTSFGDIDNDGDMDAFILNYDVNSRMYLNDGTGQFTTDIMSTCGIANTTTYFLENCTWHDFDNDCFVDLMITGDRHYIYRNNGDSTFTAVSPQPFPFQTSSTQRYMRAHAVGDLNGDGFLDVYGSYCAQYNSPSSSRFDHLWMNDSPNQGNTNHYIIFDLVGGGTSGYSNRNGIGAVVKIYGPWGVQVREVHGGEAYGIQNSFAVHFGLGQNTEIDSVIVEWPSGIVDQMMTLPADAHYTINEGGFPTSTGNINNHPFHMTMGPNPMSEQVTINLFNAEQEGGLDNLTLQIIDLNGKVVYSNASLNSNTVMISKASLAAGMYMVQVRNAEKVIDSQKLIVQ
jgi:hypothetical protein